MVTVEGIERSLENMIKLSMKNEDKSEYNHGLINGLVLALTCVTGEKFKGYRDDVNEKLKTSKTEIHRSPEPM